MAKAGFWLRGARGKLAGASAQKGQNGTILREIVKPRNPKTDKQTYQRAIMATVMKAYSAGKEIFDHAFQGVEKGQKSQQYFIARNATLLRSNIAQEINAIAAGTMQPTAAIHAAVAPKALYAVPGAYMISEGTYEQTLFDISEDGVDIPTSKAAATQDPEDHYWKQTVQSFAQKNGLVPGDIYTIVVFAKGNNIVFNGVDESGQLSDDNRTKQFNCVFGWARLQVKPDVLTTTTTVQAETEEKIIPALIPYIFELTGISHPEIFDEEYDPAEGGWPSPATSGSSFGVIRSRLDSDLRSTSYMFVDNPSSISTQSEHAYGIASPYVLPTWKKGTDALGTSELILESDN